MPRPATIATTEPATGWKVISGPWPMHRHLGDSYTDAQSARNDEHGLALEQPGIAAGASVADLASVIAADIARENLGLAAALGWL